MPVDRRGVLGLGLAASAAIAVPARAARPDAKFLWGAATAGHQVEGNNVNADIWLLEQMKPTLFAEPSGDACDSLHRWGEDVALVKALGLNCYRFSVEWSRIEAAEGQFSQAYLDHYARIVDHCRASGLAPVVTFNHFTTPRWFAARGGWEAPDAPELFARYCTRVARAMAAGISHALTFNEPNLSIGGAWSRFQPDARARGAMQALIAAAAKASGSESFSVLNGGDSAPMIPGVLRAHRLGRDAIKAVRGDLPVGMSLAISDDVGVGPDSLLAAKRRARYEPFFEAGRDDDFVGVQTYERSFIGRTGPLDTPAGGARRKDGKPFEPEAIGGAIRYAHAATGKPILVTENGIETDDDAERARFIPLAVAAVEAARRDGVPVLGYIHWSLLDNFEWFGGYKPKFGLVAVDRTTFKRTPKPSARVLGAIARAGGTR
ncbi:family 1 glycosylhydrolase [Sphingomonas sp. AR_OL41]|uniref:family 1 glycosylhydrolase n=1 Tax=Sphingomonas sp. AR_OL41 TaxID=3042729 RepID=UPI002480AF64|nr:family 1 glycosylhydrolase [Sphingomonas sp. AR_OL41]MDH7972940.1 family 1 glycosylhydrolase [Sphingomonas sp. AR_OL41]